MQFEGYAAEGGEERTELVISWQNYNIFFSRATPTATSNRKPTAELLVGQAKIVGLLQLLLLLLCPFAGFISSGR